MRGHLRRAGAGAGLLLQEERGDGGLGVGVLGHGGHGQVEHGGGPGLGEAGHQGRQAGAVASPGAEAAGAGPAPHLVRAS